MARNLYYMKNIEDPWVYNEFKQLRNLLDKFVSRILNDIYGNNKRYRLNFAQRARFYKIVAEYNRGEWSWKEVKGQLKYLNRTYREICKLTRVANTVVCT